MILSVRQRARAIVVVDGEVEDIQYPTAGDNVCTTGLASVLHRSVHAMLDWESIIQ